MIITLTILSLVVLAAFAAHVATRGDDRRLHPILEALTCVAVIGSTCWTIAIGSHLATYYLLGRIEIDGAEYREVASARGSDASLDAIIAEAMQDGSISYWEFDRIRRASDAKDRIEGRTGLANTLSDGRPPVLRSEQESEVRS